MEILLRKGNNMIYCILGKSNSGKTTLAKYLKDKMNIETVITCTTRPMRSSEKQHIDYHFLSKEEADKLLELGEFVETTYYTVAGGDVWLYGTKKSDIDTSKNQLIVVNPYGYKSFKEIYGDNVIGIYLNPPLLVRLKRILKRDKNGYKGYREAIRRFFADEKDFKGLKDVVEIKRTFDITKSL